ncbi:MAG: toll/interleukin-1 receptor domain-containing protein [Chloroflexi bacterium]|nr:toll/interleukin-1 receptor domain-containing protein [Chloroflexota bacterium]
MAKIFISYRRKDTQGFAIALYNQLRDRFGEEAIFMDIDVLKPGANFVEQLQMAVSKCEVLIALIGNQWLSIEDDDGNRRLDNPDDFVRVEIATAIERGIRVIPVLVMGATMPDVHDLPNRLKMFASVQAFFITDRFNTDISQLINLLEEELLSDVPKTNVRRFLAITGYILNVRSNLSTKDKI